MFRITVAIPVYDMKNGQEFLKRSLDALSKQAFKDFDVVISDDSQGRDLEKFCASYKGLNLKYYRHIGVRGMATNTNNAIRLSEGELIKILFQDDFLVHDFALQDINNNFTPKVNWLVTGCEHFENGNVQRLHIPRYSNLIAEGVNTIGSPSVLTIRNKDTLKFDENLGWVLDCDYYKRLYNKYGEPEIIERSNVVIGIGDHQTTSTLSDDKKQEETNYLIQKHGSIT